MRRALAFLLVALFGISLVPPAAFASDAESKLPACCRRNGKHHCAMAVGHAETTPGPAVQAARCPLFPATPAVPAHETAVVSAVSLALFHGLAVWSAPIEASETLSLISYSQAGQKRGPPAFFS